MQLLEREKMLKRGVKNHDTSQVIVLGREAIYSLPGEKENENWPLTIMMMMSSLS